MGCYPLVKSNDGSESIPDTKHATVYLPIGLGPFHANYIKPFLHELTHATVDQYLYHDFYLAIVKDKATLSNLSKYYKTHQVSINMYLWYIICTKPPGEEKSHLDMLEGKVKYRYLTRNVIWDKDKLQEYNILKEHF